VTPRDLTAGLLVGEVAEQRVWLDDRRRSRGQRVVRVHEPRLARFGTMTVMIAHTPAPSQPWAQ
jgi:hypothetical protein